MLLWQDVSLIMAQCPMIVNHGIGYCECCQDAFTNGSCGFATSGFDVNHDGHDAFIDQRSQEHDTSVNGDLTFAVMQMNAGTN